MAELFVNRVIGYFPVGDRLPVLYRFEEVTVSRGCIVLTWQQPKVDCSPFPLVLQAKEQIGNRTYVNPLVHFVCKGKVQVSFLTDNVVR